MSDHSDSSDDSNIPSSSYPVLKPPGEMKSHIPSHLLVDASPQDQHIMHSLSISAQYNEWLVNALVETHGHVRRTNGRLLRAEADIVSLKDDRKTVVKGWKLIVAIAGVAAGVISFLITIYQALSGGGR